MKLRNPIAKELRTPKYKSKVIENKKKKLEDDDKHWITHGYEGTEILVKGSDIHNLLDEDVDEGLFGENDSDLVARVKKETGGSVDE
jgi:hypothetical protein|tara:strand:+ start:214 stop:474 length:261 start_codon:yes stop_codon:yes gene_type:complete